jgi:hypothetical protein
MFQISYYDWTLEYLESHEQDHIDNEEICQKRCFNMFKETFTLIMC